MSKIHRTPQDVYALIIPQSPLRDEYNAGDEVIIWDEDRAMRLQHHEWVDSVGSSDGNYTAKLTNTGAAVMNFWSNHEDEEDILDIMEEGVGTLVERALEEANVSRKVEQWNVEELSEDRVTVVGKTPDGIRVTRKYRLEEEQSTS